MKLLKYFLSLLLLLQVFGSGDLAQAYRDDMPLIGPSIQASLIQTAHAADIPTGEYSVEDSQGEIDKISDETSFRQYLLKVLNFFLSFVGIVATAMVIYGGYLFIISNGDDAQKEKGQKIVIYACIGILIILASYALVNTILSNAGEGCQDRNGCAGEQNTYVRGHGTINRLINPFGLIGYGSVGRQNNRVGAGTGIDVGSAGIAVAGGGVCFNEDGSLNTNIVNPLFPRVDTGHPDYERCKFLAIKNLVQVGECYEIDGTLKTNPPNSTRLDDVVCPYLLRQNPELNGICYDENGFLKSVFNSDAERDICLGKANELEGGTYSDCVNADGSLRTDLSACKLTQEEIGSYSDCFNPDGSIRNDLSACTLTQSKTGSYSDCFNADGTLKTDLSACTLTKTDLTGSYSDCYDNEGFLRDDLPACLETAPSVNLCFDALGKPKLDDPLCAHLFTQNVERLGQSCYDDEGNILTGEACGKRNPGSSGPGFGNAIENPIRVTGTDVNDYGDGVIVPLEVARTEGVDITIDAEGRAQIDYGDGTSGFQDLTVDGKTIFGKRYGKKGIYNLTARVENEEGQVQNFRKQIIVGGATANIISGAKTYRVGDRVSFNGERSTAEVGTLISYKWSCSGGPGCFADEENENITVEFTEPGDYEVKLEVESSIGAKDETIFEITVKGNKPIAAFEFESTGDTRHPAQYRFDGGKSTDTEGENKGLRYIWDFDGDIVETDDRVFIYEFPSAGEKVVKLKVLQSDGPRNLISDPESDTEDEKTLTVETIIGCDVLIDNESIVGIDNPMIVRGKRTRYEIKSDQATNYEWTFTGVGGESSTQIDRVAYYTHEEISDSMSIELRVIDDLTDDERDCGFMVRVRRDGLPTAIIDVNVDGETIYKEGVTIQRGDEITFSSLSVDDTGGNENLVETWRVNGRLVRDPSQINNYFKKLGDYEIQLIAANKDDRNVRDIDEFTVTVVNRPPTVLSLSQSADSRLGLRSVKVEADAEDLDGTIDKYTFQVINAETGGIELGQTRKENFAYFNLTQFPGRFQYRFRVIVTDNDGAKAESDTDLEETTAIEIDNFPPEVSIYLTPSNAGTLDTIFTFVGQGTDEDGDALTYEWSFPDGTWFEETRNYRFEEIGTYVVTLTVSDGLDTATTDVEVIVEENLEDFDDTPNTPPEAEIHAVLPSLRVPVNSPVYFYSRGNDLDGDVLNYEWNLGDGRRTQVQHTIHTYVNEGTYNVTLEATDGIDTVIDETTIEVVSAEEAETLDPEVLAFLQNQYENNGEPLTEEEQAALLEALENKVEIGTYQNFDNLTPDEQEAIRNSEKLGSYTNLNNLTPDEQDRLKNLLNSELGSYTNFEDLTPEEQDRLKNALELGTYRDFDNLSPDEREAITNMMATGSYKNFDDLSQSEKEALENILRTGTYKYLTEMTPDEIQALKNDLEGGTYGEMSPEDIKKLINKLETGSYGQLTEDEWKILQTKAMLGNRQGIDIESLKNKGYADRSGSIDLEKLRNAGYINADGNIDLASLRNGGLISADGEVDLESLKNRGLTDADGNLNLEELRKRGFVNSRGQLDLEAMRNPSLLGYGSEGLPNMNVDKDMDVEDNAYIYSNLKPKIDERLKQCRAEIAKAPDAQERQRLQKLCDELEIQEKRAIDSLSAIDILKLEAMVESDPFIREQLKKRIANIENDLENPAEFEFVSIGGNPSTTFFLYGVAPDDYPRALSFEWDMGDGRKLYGQNISVQYDKPGIYRVTFTVSDGVLEVSDFLRIHVLEPAPRP